MVDVIMNFGFWIFIVACIGVVVLVSMNTFSDTRPSRKPKSNKETVHAFLSSANNVNKGHLFVLLINSGFFVTLMSANHSGVFDDDRQLQDFKRFSSEDMSKALKEVGDSYEGHYV